MQTYGQILDQCVFVQYYVCHYIQGAGKILLHSKMHIQDLQPTLNTEGKALVQHMAVGSPVHNAGA